MQHRVIFYRAPNWQGVKLTQMLSIFTSKSLENFDKNSEDTIQSKKDKGIKVPSIMPIRVNHRKFFTWTPKKRS